FGVVLSSVENQLGGFGYPNDPRQEPGQTEVATGDTKFDKRCREHGFGGGQADVAGSGKRHAGTHRMPVDRCDGRLGDAGQGTDEVGSIAQGLGEARRWISFVAPRHIVATVETLLKIEAGA